MPSLSSATVRGLYGEGSDVYGNVYQLSNQITWARAKKRPSSTWPASSQILHSERQAGVSLEKERRLTTEDWLYRSYGVLQNARILSSQEAMELLSDLKLGIDLGIIPHGDPELVKQLMVQIRAAHLQSIMGSPAGSERDRLRACLVRDTLEKHMTKTQESR